MLTVLHAADFHLDSPFRSLPTDEAVRRRGEQRRALAALRDLALEEGADLVLLAGDLFDARETHPETLEALAQILGQLPCPVCIAPGNHDYWSDHSPYAVYSWPGNVHIFQDEAMTPLPFPELGVTVYGCAFTASGRDSDPLAGFRAQGAGLSIGLVHGEVGGAGSYAPISPSSIAESDLTYLALGHIHQSAISREGPVCWAYPGCLQGRGFDELGDKGALVIGLEPGRAAPRFRPLPGPRYQALERSVSGADPAQVVLEALGECAREDYVRLTLTGETPPLDLPALRALTANLCRRLELRDDTSAPRDLWARAEEETLTGLFLRQMRQKLDAAAEADRPVLQLALRFGLNALEGREEPV